MIHETVHIDCEYQKAGLVPPARNASLRTWFPDNSPEMNPARKRPTVIICPGGAYEFVSEREAEPIALRLTALGFNAAVLTYSCKPAVFPTALLELAAAVALARSRAEEWHVDPARVFVMGFSAGAHLAASLGTFWNDPALAGDFAAGAAKGLCASGLDIKPTGMVLCYPVISSGPLGHDGSFRALLGEDSAASDPSGTKVLSPLRDKVSLEKQVSADTPPAFIWHTFEDELVPVENSLMFARALRDKGIPFELHIYQRGKHGLSSATEDTLNNKGWGIEPACQNWIDMAALWMKNLLPAQA